MYKDELDELRKELEKKKDNFEYVKRTHKEFQIEIEELASYIERNTERIQKLSLPTMSIEEAYTRLAELTASSSD